MGRATWKSRLTGSAARFAVGFLGLQYFQVGQCRSRVRDRRWSPETGFSQPHRNRPLASGALCKNAFLIDARAAAGTTATLARTRCLQLRATPLLRLISPYLAVTRPCSAPRKDSLRSPAVDPTPPAPTGSHRRRSRKIRLVCFRAYFHFAPPAFNPSYPLTDL